MGWTSLLDFFLLRKPKRTYTTVDEFHNMDTAVQLKSCFDEEALLVENGEVVGETAVVTVERQLKPTAGPLPSRYQVFRE
jgi:hypothetical protein